MSTKKCGFCGGRLEYEMYYDSADGSWVCDDCVEAMVGRFYHIFRCRLLSIGEGGLVIGLADLKRILKLIKRNTATSKWEITDYDRKRVGG